MRKKRIVGEERDCVWILYIYTKRLFILQSAAEKTDRESEAPQETDMLR